MVASTALKDEWTRRLQWWIGAVGVALLGQGATSLGVRAGGIELPPLAQAFVADPLHAGIHVAWGVVMLGTLATRGDRETLSGLALAFGVFYVALAFLGVLVYHPFGLMLGPGENAFHFVVGPTSLVLGVWGRRARPWWPASAS